MGDDGRQEEWDDNLKRCVPYGFSDTCGSGEFLLSIYIIFFYQYGSGYIFFKKADPTSDKGRENTRKIWGGGGVVAFYIFC